MAIMIAAENSRFVGKIFPTCNFHRRIPKEDKSAPIVKYLFPKLKEEWLLFDEI